MRSKKHILLVGHHSNFSAIALQAMASEFPLIVTAEAKNETAFIRVTGAIYEWNNSAEEITRSIDNFLADGIQNVEVYLNGPGGDVFQAAEIENQIMRFPGSKTGTGGALIASAYTKIAAALDSFSQAENGQYMYHKPSGYISGNEDKVESSLVLLKNLTAEYKATYSSITGLTADEIETNWSKGDVWLTAKEAAKQKFITGVIKKASITKDTKAMFEAVSAPKIPRITNNENQINIMDKARLCALLGLAADASEAQIEAALTANKEAAATVTALKNEKLTAEANALTEKVTALINGAVTEKKITADQVANLTSWAKNDFEACESHIKALKPLGQISAAIIPGSTDSKKFEEMTTAEREEMANENPEEFKKAYLAHLSK